MTAPREGQVPKRPIGRCWIYFVRCNEFVKIGRAVNVPARFLALQAGSPYPLDLIGIEAGDAAREQTLHAKFRASHVRGEWFRIDDGPLLAYLENVAREFECQEMCQEMRHPPGSQDELERELIRLEAADGQ